MPPIRFVHTGDEHIDNDTHGGLNPATGRNRAWESNAACLRAIAQRAADEKVDAFVHAGDATKHGRPTIEALLMYADAVAPVVEAGIPVVLLGGNHQLLQVPSSHRTATAALGRLLAQRGADVHVFERTPELLRLNNGLQIGCIPWLSKTWVLGHLGKTDLDPAAGDQAVVDFAVATAARMCEEADPSSPLILASHMTVTDVRIDGPTAGHRRGSEVDLTSLFAEPVIPRHELEALPFSYIGLSHIHTRQRIGMKLYYAGAPNRFTFTDAGDPKSANLVTIGDDNTLLTVDHIATPARHLVNVDLTTPNYQDALNTLTPDSIARIVLAPGDRVPPEHVTAAVTASRAMLAEVKVTPVPQLRRTVAVLPEKVDPQAGLVKWLDTRTTPTTLPVADVLAAAAQLVEDASA